VDPELQSIAMRNAWTITDLGESIEFTRGDGKRATARWEHDRLGWYLTCRDADGHRAMLSNEQSTKGIALQMTQWSKLHFV